MKGRPTKRESAFIKSLRSLSRTVTSVLEKKKARKDPSLNETAVELLISLEAKLHQLVKLLQEEAAEKNEISTEQGTVGGGKDTVDHPRAAEVEKPNVEPREPISLPLKKRKVKVTLNPRECPVCHRILSTKIARNNHIIIMHTSERPFKCLICNRGFPANYLLQYHMKKHEPPQYECRYCGKRFAQHFLKTSHEETHVGEKKHVCWTCGKCFLRASNLKLHQEVHNENKQPFVCQECGAEFAQKLSLTVHLRKHTGVGLHRCSKCDKTFTRLVELQRHSASHDETRHHLCESCGKRFKYRAGLKYHVKTAHAPDALGSNSVVQCNKCPLKFENASSFKRHLKKHESCNYACSICSELFTDHSELMKHENKVHVNKDYYCHCGASFANSKKLEAHSKIHLPSATCSLCNKRFKTEKNLFFHKKKCHPGDYALMNALGSAVQVGLQPNTNGASELFFYGEGEEQQQQQIVTVVQDDGTILSVLQM